LSSLLADFGLSHKEDADFKKLLAISYELR